MKLKLIFMALVIGLSISSCKKNNDIVLKYQMESKIDYSIKFFLYDLSGEVIDVEYDYVRNKQNKLFIPNQTEKLMIFVNHGYGAEGVIDYKLNNTIGKYKYEGQFIFDKQSDNLTHTFNF